MTWPRDYFVQELARALNALGVGCPSLDHLDEHGPAWVLEALRSVARSREAEGLDTTPCREAIVWCARLLCLRAGDDVLPWPGESRQLAQEVREATDANDWPRARAALSRLEALIPQGHPTYPEVFGLSLHIPPEA